MNLSEALEQIDSIHEHLAKGEEYRGYRPLSLVISGLLGLLAALVQPWLAVDDPLEFVSYWLMVACLCATVAGGATLFGYIRDEDEFARRRTRTVMRQFLPCLLVGAIVTVVLARAEHTGATVRFLPGLWSLLYGLGAVASLPYLPRLAGLVAVWYLAAGCLLLMLGLPATPGSVGLPFGIGQVLAGIVLYLTRRPEMNG
jgi:hypothetical protein